MSAINAPGSTDARFSPDGIDDLLMPVHATNDLMAFAEECLRMAKSLWHPTDVRLIASLGDGLPGVAICLDESGIRQLPVDRRWLATLEVAVQRERPYLCILDHMPGGGMSDPESALALPLHALHGNFHALALAGGESLRATVSAPAAMRILRHLRTALGRVLVSEEDCSLLAGLRGFAARSCVGLIALDWEMRVKYSNRAAVHLCERWTGCAGDGAARNGRARIALPPLIADECRRLKQAQSLPASDATPPVKVESEAAILCPASPALRAHIRVIPSTGLRAPGFQIRIENPLSATGSIGRRGLINDDIRTLLSPVEREVLAVAIQGHPNEIIARELGKSLSTIKTQLQSIYRKLGVSKRGELLARLAGLSANGSRNLHK